MHPKVGNLPLYAKVDLTIVKSISTHEEIRLTIVKSTFAYRSSLPTIGCI